MTLGRVLLGSLLLLLISDAAASSEIEARTGLWSSDRQLNDLGPFVNFGLAARTRGQIGEQGHYRIDLSGNSEISRTISRTYGLIREGFIGIDTDRFEWVLGWQQHAWGRGDRINPTDLLSPRDFRRLTPIDEETRVALPGVTAKANISEGLRLIALAQHFQPSRMYSETSEEHFNRTLGATSLEWALKLDRAGGDVDWSVSYFSGMEKARNLVLASCTTANPFPVREHAAIRSYGADFAAIMAGYGWRGEIARVESVNHSPVVCGGRSGYTAAVIGIDRNILDETTLGLQVFTRHYDEDVEERPSGAQSLASLLDTMQGSNYQQRRNLSGVALRYAQNLSDINWDWEITAVSHFQFGDLRVRPLANYHLGDMSQIRIGSDLYRGPGLSPFGLLRQNSSFFLEYAQFL